MDKINHCINHNRFIPIDTEELSALELIGKTVEKTNEVVEKSNNHEDRISENERKKVSFDDMKEKFKFDNNFSDIDYRGKWFGLDEPTLSDEGMRSQVEKNSADILKHTEQLDSIANKGTTVEVLERVTKEEIDRQVADGTIANLTIENYSIDVKKLNFAKYNSLGNSIININDFDTIGKLNSNGDIYTDNISYKTTSKFVEVMGGEYIESNSRSGASGLVQVCFYSSPNISDYIGTIQNDANTGVFVVPKGAKYVRFSINITNLEYYPNIKIQKGNFIQPIIIDRPYKLNIISENEIYHNKITVKKDGSGDFTTIQQAIAWIKDSSFNNRYDIMVYEGDYDVYSNLNSEQLERGIILPDYTCLIGVGRKEKVILRGQHLVGENNTNVTMRSPLNINKNNGLKNLTVIAKNSRYAVHADNSNYYKDYEWNIENCDFIHEGNDSSFTWQTCIAWGSGSASGCREYFKNCTFKGKVGYTTHNNINFETDTYQEFVNCKFIADVRINSVDFLSMNSGVNHKVVFNGCQFTGSIKNTLSGATDVEYSISGFGNSKVAHVFPSTSNKFINFSDEINTSVVVSKNFVKGDVVRDYGYQVEPQWGSGTKDTFYGGICLNNANVGDVCFFKHSGYIDLTNILATVNGDYIGVVGGKLAKVSNKNDSIGQVIQGNNFMKLF